MKKTVLLVFLVVNNVCVSQEWFTSLEVAKRLALVQDKMLFVMWEGALGKTYPVIINDDKGNEIIMNLSDNDIITELIWKYFVPVLILETEYEKMVHKVKETKGLKYFNKLTDDSIKIMDVNGNILNINQSAFNFESITQYITRYGLNTSFLKNELKSYFNDKNATSAFFLASKYLDYAIFMNKEVRPEIISLANIYFKEAREQLLQSSYDNKMAFLQKLELFEIKALLILNKPKKARRILKKTDGGMIVKINQSLFSFLNYTTFKLLKDNENASIWKSKVSLVDLKKANLISKNYLTSNGSSN